DECETSRIGDGPPGTGDHYLAVLERLAEPIQQTPGKLEQLIEEQHAVVGETDLAGARHPTAAEQPGARHRVVRRPKWSRRWQGVVRPQHAGDRLHGDDLQRLR